MRRLPIGLCLGLLLPVAARAADRPVPALHEVQTYEISGEPSTATDVRWASDGSIYLARQYDGVAEVRLASGLPWVRQVVPKRETLGVGTYRAFSRLAATSDHLAWGETVGLVAWRSLAPAADRKVRYDWKSMAYAEDLDVSGDRLLVLGGMVANDPEETFSPDGAVAFLGSVRVDGRQAFQPVLFDPAGPGAPHLLHCGRFDLGGVRFLADGSLFILPGFQPGAYLFSAGGALVRSWNTALLGLDADADCASLTMPETLAIRNRPESRMLWLNRHRVVDAVLALPDGPALVIRSVAAGAVHWELDVLGAGGVEAYAIPVSSRSARERLRGDYRNGKLVFLITEENLRLHAERAPSRLVVLEMPGGRP